MGWTRFFRRRRWDQERARELDAYLGTETADNISRGMSPEDALVAARKKLGNRTLIREEIYQMNTIQLIETLWQDLRYGARLLRLNPGFALIAIASLALGIGANTAIFQLINAVRLRTLPVRNPQELVEVRLAHPVNVRGSINSPYAPLTTAIWERIRDDMHIFSGTFAWAADSFNIAPSGEARFANAILVSGDFFSVLGIPPALGRVF